MRSRTRARRTDRWTCREGAAEARGVEMGRQRAAQARADAHRCGDAAPRVRCRASTASIVRRTPTRTRNGPVVPERRRRTHPRPSEPVSRCGRERRRLGVCAIRQPPAHRAEHGGGAVRCRARAVQRRVCAHIAQDQASTRRDGVQRGGAIVGSQRMWLCGRADGRRLHRLLVLGRAREDPVNVVEVWYSWRKGRDIATEAIPAAPRFAGNREQAATESANSAGSPFRLNPSPEAVGEVPRSRLAWSRTGARPVGVS